ncbi:hypothetical protein G6F59_018232 [Rhizopus arrhizus]|nr:hypothetical protein G6F59_018232 [Rhizopus arrhizus]
MEQRAGAAHVIGQHRPEFVPERGILSRLAIGPLQIIECGDQGLGHVAAAVGAELPERVGGIGVGNKRHDLSPLNTLGLW